MEFFNRWYNLNIFREAVLWWIHRHRTHKFQSQALWNYLCSLWSCHQHLLNIYIWNCMMDQEQYRTIWSLFESTNSTNCERFADWANLDIHNRQLDKQSLSKWNLKLLKNLRKTENFSVISIGLTIRNMEDLDHSMMPLWNHYHLDTINLLY